MINAITSKSTKAELLAHIAVLDARILAGARMVRDLREQIVMAPQPDSMFVAPPPMHKAYYEYVRVQRVLAKAQGTRVATYLPFDQWVVALRTASQVPA